MRRARILRWWTGVLLAGWIGSAGCTHNYYYGSVPVACAPGTTTGAPATVTAGSSICDLPSQLFGRSRGTIVAASPGVQTNVTSTAPPSSATSSSDVVVSEPASRPRLSWRRSDPESGVATTRVDGAINEEDSTVK
jgi:hypothetical protein